MKCGVLVIHGLTGTPELMEPVTGALKDAGFVVKTPLLPGHGTTVEDLSSRKWEEWWKVVEKEYNSLKKEVDLVFAAGISLGALLTIKLTLEKKLKAAALISTPLKLVWPIEYISYPLVKYTPFRFFYKDSKKDWNKAIQDPVGREIYKKNSYDRMPIRSILELFRLKKELLGRLEEIKTPLLVAHGKMERTAPISNVAILERRVPATIETHIYEHSGHVLTLDYEADKLVQALVAFFSRFS